MDRVLNGLQGTELFVYLDDIVIYASNLTEHAQKFNKLIERLRKAKKLETPTRQVWVSQRKSLIWDMLSARQACDLIPKR